MNAALWNCWKLQNANKHAELGEIKYHKCVWKNSFLRHLCSCLRTMNCCPFQERRLQRLQMVREEHRSCRRDLLYLPAIWGGGRDNSGKVSVCAFVMISTHVSTHVAEHPVVPRCLRCLTALYESCLCYAGFMFWRDLMRTFPVSGMVWLLIGREAVRYEMNEWHKQLFFNVLFQLFFPWEFPSSCACFPHLSHCKRVDPKRENTILKDVSEIITDWQGENLVVGDETGRLEIRN